MSEIEELFVKKILLFVTNLESMDRFLAKTLSSIKDKVPKSDCEDCTVENNMKRKRKFRTEWLQLFSWLQNKNGSSYCVACEKEISNHLSYIKKHGDIPTHAQNVEKKKNQISMETFMNQENRNFLKQVHQVELALVMFLIVHNLLFLLMDSLPQLLIECCPDSKIAKSIKCGRTKATELTEIIGNKAKSAIISKLQDTKFSLIVDETTDVSTKKSLVLVVRYFDKFTQNVQDKFLGLIEMINTDANSLYEAIKKFFGEHNIPLKNIIGLATDGASVMAGDINGLQAKFKKDVDILYTKCACHSLHLCSAYACKKLPIAIETICRDIYKFFSHSPKRISKFKEFQEYCSVKPHKILGISLTRWLALEQVINRLVEQWSALRLYFISCHLEVNGIKAAALAELMDDGGVKVYFLFLSYVLNIVNNLNKEFQSEKIRLPYFYSHIETNFKLILSNFMNNEHIKSFKSLEAIDLYDETNYLPLKEIYIGSKAELLLENSKLSDSQKNEIKANILNFYLELLKQIQQRFDFSREDLKNLSIITPCRVLSESETSLQSLICHFPHLVDGDVEKVITQWKLLRFSYAGLNSEMDIVEFWEKVASFKNGLGENCFEALTNFVRNLISLPHSSAAAERKFSDLSLIKTKNRNKLDFKTINSIMLSKELCFGKNEPHYVWSAKDFNVMNLNKT